MKTADFDADGLTLDMMHHLYNAHRRLTHEAAWHTFSVVSVCMFVIFVHPVYLERIQVKFAYVGHRVKVKVRGAIRSEVIPIPAMQNMKMTDQLARRSTT